MENDYISEYLKNSGAIEPTCNDKDKSLYKMHVKKCLDNHCKRSNKSRLENGKCPKGVAKKSKKKSKNRKKKSTNKKQIKKKSKNQS